MRNQKKRKFEKYTPGEVVKLTEDRFYQFHTNWAIENGYRQGEGRQLQANTKGKFVSNSSEGPIYKIVEVNGEHFEIIHANLKKDLLA